jgi:dienelactone hydrolase
MSMLRYVLLFLILCMSAGWSQTAEQKTAAASFLDAVLARDWDMMRTLAHPDMQQKVAMKQWEELISNLESKGGVFRGHRFDHADMHRNYAGIVHRLYLEKDSIGIRMIVDSANLVGAFRLEPIAREYSFPHPPYADTTQFSEVELMLGKEPRLPGVLSIPRGKGPFPAVVLVHGAGPQDRDQTIMGNKMFRDIAWGLASQGIVVLRYDKRTRVHGPKMSLLELTVQEETIDDAIDAVAVLRSRDEVDTARLTLLGHGLGATLAPEIASKSMGVKSVIMLAPAARPLEVVISDQLRYIASQQDTLTDQEATKLHMELEKVAGIQAGTLEANRMLLGTPASWYYDLHTRDRKSHARSLNRPIFIARGEKDYQAPQMEYVLWRQYLEGIPNVEFRTYSRCYHLFIETDARPGPWNYSMEGHVAKRLIDDVASWCREIAAPPAEEPAMMKEYRVR